MDITNMLNSKGNLAAHHHFSGFIGSHQHHPHHPQFPLVKPEPDMERSVSPHGSEHSHYSTSNMSRSYASPGPMHTQMHMANAIPSQMSLPSFPDMPGMGGVPMQHMHQAPPQAQAQPPAKTYPCGTCHKRFARRSDLARHGKIA